MNGPEHYKEAERILSVRAKTGATSDIAAAQVHATLALVAAVANRGLIDGLMPALALAPRRYEKDEHGEYEYRFPWQEALQ